MSSLISGLNIKNIYEYNSEQSYEAYDIVDYQLNDSISFSPENYNSQSQVADFWFQNRFLSDFKLDTQNNVSGWFSSSFGSSSASDNSDRVGGGLLVQNDIEKRPYIGFDVDYLEFIGNQSLTGEEFFADQNYKRRTTFLCFDASASSDSYESQTILRFDKENDHSNTVYSSSELGRLKIKGQNNSQSAKFVIDGQEISAQFPIYDFLNIVTLVQYEDDNTSYINIRQNGKQIGSKQNFYKGWESGFLAIGSENLETKSIKYYELLSLTGIVSDETIQSIEKYLYEEYSQGNDFYFAKSDIESNVVPSSFSAEGKWTQNINDLFSISYGSSSKFTSKLSRCELGDGYESIVSLGVNSLLSSFDLNYEGLTDKQAKCLLAYFQSTPENKNSYSISEGFDGVNVNLFTPYSEDSSELYFLDLNHTTPYNNINNISIKAESLYHSNLDYKGMFVKLDETNIKTFNDDLQDFKYHDVFYYDDALFSKRGYYFYTGQDINTTLEEENKPLGANSYFTKSFYFKPDIDYSIGSKLNLTVVDYADSTKQYLKNGINYNKLEFDLTFSNRSERETRALLKFLDSKAGVKTFEYTLPQPYNKSMQVLCPEWSHVYNFKDNHTVTAKFIEIKGLSSNDSTVDRHLNTFIKFVPYESKSYE